MHHRLIPARAGNTRSDLARHHGASAHPRSRGEHLLAAVVLAGTFGSSPLARGTQLERVFDENPSRLIPARAGNTAPRHSPWEICEAHPRSRGEHVRIVAEVGGVAGSSPLARGTPDFHAEEWRRDRLIPARAGNTFMASSRSGRHSAHPRSRGEHRLDQGVIGLCVGSSPLARGTPAQHAPPSASNRLIPARAGNTSLGPPRVAARTAHPRSRGEHKSGTMPF